MIKITKSGIWFPYKRDDILWVFPWRRDDNNRFVSILANAGFKSLKELDEFWEGYWKAQ